MLNVTKFRIQKSSDNELLLVAPANRYVGSIGDTDACVFVFNRPTSGEYDAADLILYFYVNGAESVHNIGQSDEYVVTGDFTALPELPFKVAFSFDGALLFSNVATASFRSSFVPTSGGGGGGGGDSYVLPQATSAFLGGVKADPIQTVDTQPVRINPSTGKLFTATPDIPELEPYELPRASDTVLGGIKAAPITAQDVVPVHIDPESGRLFTQESGGLEEIPQASINVTGGIRAVNRNATTDTQSVNIDPATGRLYTQPAPEPESYNLPQASATILGGVKAGPITEQDTQPVHIDPVSGGLMTKSASIAAATEATLGGIKATTIEERDIQEVRIDPISSKLYVPFVFNPFDWPLNTEVDLGDGTFGFRAEGTSTAAQNELVQIVVPCANDIKLFIEQVCFWGSREGHLISGNVYNRPTFFSYLDYDQIGDTAGFSAMVLRNIYDSVPRNNLPWFFWMRYIKE